MDIVVELHVAPIVGVTAAICALVCVWILVVAWSWRRQSHGG